jgi:hypothetical protein
MSVSKSAPGTGVDEQRIRERAYALWEQANCPDGQAEEFWSLAQQEISMQQADGGTLQKSSSANDLPASTI